MSDLPSDPPSSPSPETGDSAETKAETPLPLPEPPPHAASPGRAGAFTQFLFVLLRRFRIFFRELGQVWLQLALILLFPGLVVIFAYHGLPQIKNLSMNSGSDIIRQLSEATTFTAQTAKVGGLVSGLVMIEVVLLTLMASNNSAREIAGERLIFEKEKLAGLRPESYLAAKICFLLFLVTAQSVWMTIFVKFVCQFPGDLPSQFLSLFLANAAMTSICLGISSWASSPEQASMISIYLVGFQLPLSGAVLALPEPLGAMVRPFITSYWSWSSYLQTLQDTRFYDMVKTITETPLSGPPCAGGCFWGTSSSASSSPTSAASEPVGVEFGPITTN